MLRLITLGFLSMLVQVACLRELDVAFYGIELIYPLALAVWLLWTAAGAFLSLRALRPTPRKIALLFLVAAVALPLDVAFIRGSRVLLGGMRGAYLPLELQLATVGIALFPPGFLMGLLFQWSAKVFVARGETLAAAYAVESVGAVLGGLAATSLLLAGLQNFATIILCAAICALAAAFSGDRSMFGRTAGPLCHGLGLAGIALLAISGWLDEGMTEWNHPGLVASRDSAYGRVTVRKLGGQVAVFENDALSFDTESTAAEELAHLAALQHRSPRTFMVVGGALSGLVREALKHRPERVHAVEVNPLLTRIALPLLPSDAREPLRDPAVRLDHGEPRRILASPETYDVILVGMPDPTSAQANRFYTREFFALCSGRLNPEGILAFSLSSAENLLAPPKARRLSSIVRAARAEFHDVLVLPAGSRNIVVASRAELAREPEPLVARILERGISARLVIPPYVEYVLTDARGERLARIVDETEVPLNSDVEPICYQYTAMDWLSKFVPAAAFVDLSKAIRSGRVWPFIAAIGGLFVVSRLRAGLRRAALAAVAGFAGMAVEATILLHYQVKSGVLFQDVGILLMAFMLGLASGAAAVHRLDVRSGRRGGRARGLWLLLAFAALCGLSANAVRLGGLSSLPEAAVCLGGAGALTAGVFAHASLHGVEDQEGSVSPLYAADLLGGCLAAALVTLVAVPALGLVATLWGAAAIALLAIILL